MYSTPYSMALTGHAALHLLYSKKIMRFWEDEKYPRETLKV